MKKTIIIALFLGFLLPSVGLASIDQNLKYGMKNTEVSELQDFLVDQNLMTQSTGFFGVVTLKAVQKFQTTNNIPSTGYVGMLTRAEINKQLALVTGASDEAEMNEVGTITPAVCGVGVSFNTKTGQRCPNDPLVGQITQLQNQVNALNDSIKNQATNTPPIATSTSTEKKVYAISEPNSFCRLGSRIVQFTVTNNPSTFVQYATSTNSFDPIAEKDGVIGLYSTDINDQGSINGVIENEFNPRITGTYNYRIVASGSLGTVEKTGIFENAKCQ